uniref:O-acyltransferase WSD1 C-terminal domain-containing protein n=1 Tax=Kalanchoe fedtschenkoi TaxID=63787 RepID=A0A7N0TFJ9_KALFE
MVNLRSVAGIPEISDLVKAESGSGWGNKISFMLHPIRFHKPKEESDPLRQLKLAKASMDQKKSSKVARLCYIVGNLAKTFFGPNFATWLLYRMACNTTFAFSNIVGPSQEVTLVGKRVTSLKISVSSVPHAITIHMLSSKK